MTGPGRTYLGLKGHYVYVETETSSLPLKHRVRHSPTGLSWGYAGSGPADLALSILWDHLGEEPSVGLYQQFKFDVVANLRDGWTLTSADVEEWLQENREKEERRERLVSEGGAS